MNPPLPQAAVTVQRFGAGAGLGPATDHVAAEEPLEIRLGGTESTAGRPTAVVMRTPGDDFDLAWGLAVSEQLVRPDDLASAHWGAPADFNAVELRLHPGAQARPGRGGEAWFVNSSCGLCGKDTIEAVRADLAPLHGLGPVLPSALLTALPERLRSHQAVFARTGGLHGAGAFNPTGDALCVREDVGRHNAVDKVIGHLARHGDLPAHELVLVVSGRAGFEIVQKAAVAGFAVVVSVSAPSSLAVELARATGMTLAGFVRSGRANVYSGSERVRP